MLIEAVGAIAILLENRSMKPYSSASGQGPRSSASIRLAASACGADVLEHPDVPDLGDHALERHVLRLQEAVEPHHAEPHRALAHRRVARPLHPLRRAVDEVLQHVVEEAHHVLDEQRMVLPLEPALQIERRQAADRGAPLAMLIDPGRQRDLAAQIAGLDLEPGQLVVLRPRVVHLVGEDQVGLAGLDPRRQDPDPQRPRADPADHRAVLRRR